MDEQRTVLSAYWVVLDKDYDILHIFCGEEATDIWKWGDEDWPGIIVQRRMSDDAIVGIQVMEWTQRRDEVRKHISWLDWDEVERRIAQQGEEE